VKSGKKVSLKMVLIALGVMMLVEDAQYEPVAGAVRAVFSGNLPKGQTYVSPT
jgi:hypothetical protein